MESQSGSTASASDDPRILHMVQSLANGYTLAAHLVTAPDQSRDFPLLPLSDYHAVVLVEPIIDFTYFWKEGLLRSHASSDAPTEYVVIYREIDQKNYDEYSDFAQGAEEKDLLSRKVERRKASSVDEVINILAAYNLKPYDLHIAAMRD